MIGFATPELKTYLRQKNVCAILLTKLDFASGFVCVHSSVGTIIHDGDSYLGVGVLGKVGSVTQNGKVQPNKLRLTLSGIPPALLSTALTEQYQNRLGQILLAALDEQSGTVIAADVLFAGRMDVMTLRDGSSANLQLDLNSRGVDWKNARNGRYTHADHLARHPGDNFFEFVSQTTERELQWGVPGGSAKLSGGSGGGGSRSTGRRVQK
ncbi:hypothetical protein CXF86_18925 [Shewanella sp. GutCb]|uniref:hypothetical protein n=1 Tax=Shewanella sp. GutCb TaxID=2058315 RepID=UPI000C7CA0EE|nr:hypothetical protein [Shewanella sp. GutCb]PKG73180.1 hypothetical protein CXF86_18925 [Shewanella sp. GutCb]